MIIVRRTSSLFNCYLPIGFTITNTNWTNYSFLLSKSITGRRNSLIILRRTESVSVMLAGFFSWSLLFHNLELLSNVHRYLYRCYVILWIFFSVLVWLYLVQVGDLAYHCFFLCLWIICLISSCTISYCDICSLCTVSQS